MSITRKKEIGGKVIEIREATVADIRNWMKEASYAQEVDVADILLFDEFFLPDIYTFTSLDKESADELTPREIAEVINELKELNPGFFALQAKILEQWRENLVNAS